MGIRALHPLIARRPAVLAGTLLLSLVAGCSTAPVSPPEAPSAPLSVNRPDGEGYAGNGELLVRIALRQPDSMGWVGGLMGHHNGADRATIEIRYLGLDSLGRAVFERRDADALAAAPARTPGAAAVAGASAAADMHDGPNVRQITLDLRMARQLRVQGKIIEVIEAAPSGVVFRLY